MAGEARRSLYENAPYVLLVAGYVLASALVLPAFGGEIPYSPGETLPTPAILTGLYVVATLLVATVVDVFVGRRPPFNLETWRRLSRNWLGTRRLVGTTIVLLTLPVLLNAMAGYRLALTDIHPFAYDELFMEWDRALHFGRHPWELLQPLIGHPAVTIVIDRGYFLGWILMMWVCTIWQAVHGREPIRMQYFLTFSACWILLGSIAAVALSSAGPVYFGRVTGLTDPYVPLMEYLASVDARTPLRSVADHERLWHSYKTWGGITAMPSMHIAITTVVALVLVRTHWLLALVAVPGWLFMIVGSVHLGWHYAIDGYAAALGAGLIWWMCGRFARRWLDRPEEAGTVSPPEETHAA